MKSAIFSEIYGAYYRAVGKILAAASAHPVTEREMRSIIEDEAFSESVYPIVSALRDGRWRLMRPDGTTPIKNPPTMPPATLELQWLKAISLDRRICLFEFDTTGLENVEPLFTPEDIRIFDKCSDGDDYTDKGYIERFRTILSAIKEARPLSVAAKRRRGGTARITLLPLYLEYSEKDDKFRLISAGSKSGGTLNLANIVSVAPIPPPFTCKPGAELGGKRAEKIKPLVLEVTDERGALERAALHFAHFEKTVERIGDDCGDGKSRYRMTLNYNASDETELLIRVLSFGPFIRAAAPDEFVELIKDRLRMQKSCGI